jgi:hypothetical protein
MYLKIGILEGLGGHRIQSKNTIFAAPATKLAGKKNPKYATERFGKNFCGIADPDIALPVALHLGCSQP